MNRPSDISIHTFKRAYFVGIGGIGMSALARYFKRQGWPVAGYDKTPSDLTESLETEGIEVHFTDLGKDIPKAFKAKEDTLVVYTPAIPNDHGELNYFKDNGFHLLKRSEVLGLLTCSSLGLGVAGTHGKTTTSALLAHILDSSELKCSAFLGGIASNFDSNLVLSTTSKYTVVEADEFDRSFLALRPFASIITSVDPDHLDIYGDADYFQEGFQRYADLICQDGFLVLKEGLPITPKVRTITYAVGSQSADVSVENMRFDEGFFVFDVRVGKDTWQGVTLGIPGIHNAENAAACIAMSLELGLNEAQIRDSIASFKGVKRRFEYHIRNAHVVYIDDYAHHPTEIHSFISSVRLMYPHRRIVGAFQPHLFSRTRDFFEAFAHELSALDELVLLPIYPARELPIEGVNSERLLAEIELSKKQLLTAQETLEYLSKQRDCVILTIGAGDIDRIVEPLTKALS
jgi:UDP-N-acetylmuramate--alanine ligase